MKATLFFQAGIAVLAASTPWIVIRLIGRPSRRLTVATAVLTVPLVGLAFAVTPPSLTLSLSALGAFMVLAGFGLADLNAIDTATRDARELTSTERVASLRPRSVGRFVSLGSRVLPYAIAVTGLAIFILRWLTPSPNRRSFVAVTFALGAIVFLGLYDRWIHEEACGPQAEGGRSELEIKHRVRGIRYLQIVLVAGLLTAGNILIGIDWVTNSAVARGCSLVAGLLGVIGAGKALGSGFTGRRYQMVRE